MKSVLRKFEKSSIDMSKVYGKGTYSTGEGSVDVNRVTRTGTEWVTEDSVTGCLVPFVMVDGLPIYEQAVC